MIKLSDSVFLKGSDGRAVNLEEGPATLEFENGLYGVYSPSATLTGARGQKFSLTLPRTKFDDLEFEAAADELAQPFGIKAERKQVILSREPVNSMESCHYCGYCHMTEVKIGSDGKTEVNRGYQNSCRCPGEREVTKERRTISESLVVEFRRARGMQAVGSFVSSSPVVFMDDSTVLSSGRCERSGIRGGSGSPVLGISP